MAILSALSRPDAQVWRLIGLGDSSVSREESACEDACPGQNGHSILAIEAALAEKGRRFSPSQKPLESWQL